MPKSDEEIQSLLMGLMDGELSPEEADEINDILRKNQRWREEYNSLLKAHQHLKGLSFEEQTDEVLKMLWKSPLFQIRTQRRSLDDHWRLHLPLWSRTLGAVCQRLGRLAGEDSYCSHRHWCDCFVVFKDSRTNRHLQSRSL